MGTVLTLPSGKTVEVSPIDGKTERILEDKKIIQSGSLIDKYLVSRIVSIDGDDSMTPQQKESVVLDMYSGDRNYLLYQLRIDSYGPEMVFNQECPTCKKTSGYKVDLNELLADGTVKIHPYHDQPLRVELPRSGGYAVISHLTGHDERKLTQYKDNFLSAAMLLLTRELNGKPPTRKDMDELIGEDLAVIRGAMDEMMEAGLDAKIELTCLNCGRDYPVGLHMIPDFFVPKKMSTGPAGW
jgi:hypothetical protein